MLNVDGWTDGRTNGRKLACLCLPAKAGATKTQGFKLVTCQLLHILPYLRRWGGGGGGGGGGNNKESQTLM